MRLLACLLPWCACLAAPAAAQPLAPVRQFLHTPVAAASADRYGRVVVADARGDITAYDTAGHAVARYSTANVAAVTALDAWRTEQVFLFYMDTQQFLLLDRFLTPLPGFPYPGRLPAAEVGFARRAALAQDDQLWLFDDADFSLKKYSPARQAVTLHTPLSLVLPPGDYQITHLQEYQNQVYMADRQAGVLVFDNLGNYRMKLPLKGVDAFRFAGDELYFADGDTVRFHHLYTHVQRSVPLPVAARRVVVSGRWFYVFTAQGGFLFRQP